VSRGEGRRKLQEIQTHPPCKARKNFLRNFKKPLDKIPKVWYNNNVPRGEGNKDVPRKALLIVVKSMFGVCVSTWQGSKKFFENFQKTP
jgi:hypothetical protein